jgi:hypothetical protein
VIHHRHRLSAVPRHRYPETLPLPGTCEPPRRCRLCRHYQDSLAAPGRP